jgi:UDP-glucose 4-epimerase
MFLRHTSTRWCTLSTESESDPTRDMALLINTVTTCLQALSEQPGMAMTFVSSGGTVYGDPEQVPTPEDAPTEPIGLFGFQRGVMVGSRSQLGRPA